LAHPHAFACWHFSAKYLYRVLPEEANRLPVTSTLKDLYNWLAG